MDEFYALQAQIKGRNKERNRVADLIEHAILGSEDKSVVAALVELAHKVLLP